MTKEMIAGRDDGRVKAVEGYYESGMRSASVSPDTAPWVRRGLQLLELGESLTSDALEKADKEQSMASPK